METTESQQNNDEQLLTTDEAASFLRMTAHTLAIHRYQGRGPTFVRFPNGRVRYRRSDLQAYVARQTVVHTKGGR